MCELFPRFYASAGVQEGYTLLEVWKDATGNLRGKIITLA